MTRQTAPDTVDYSVRTVAVMYDGDGKPAFEVVCYGMDMHAMCTIAEDESGGGQRLRRAMERRGIDTNRFVPNLFDCYEPSDKFLERG